MWHPTMGVTAASTLLADGATPVNGLKKPSMLLSSLRGLSTLDDCCGGLCNAAAPSLSPAKQYSLSGCLHQYYAQMFYQNDMYH